ncbi:MAG: DEAD/DEAH box helicase [Woeseiaceae bacterium]|jgi:ATP-dependent RNA helicase RhlE|nr:DEAD/DEAH box helicase [Woeseiaceae bacterium]
MLFNELGLSAELLRAVEEQGYTEATPIQQKAIPLILEGKDVLAGAQTGTGKTAAFTLPLLQRLQKKQDGPRRIRALILTPTRELAAQVHESVKTYGKQRPLRTMEIYGGVSARPQISKIHRGVDVVVATPGRLLDHVRQGNINLSGVEMFILDEADRMLDMGFIRDIKQIIKQLPKERQNLLFSATFSQEIRDLSKGLLNNHIEVEVAQRNSTADRVEQLVMPVDKLRKRELLSEQIGKGNWRQVLVFTRTKHGANRLAKQLNIDGIETLAIHGGKGQGARTKALRDFKAGSIRVLVATDIAARGLDIDKLPHVVNYELPHVPEDYVHRIGRTARAGQDGTAISLVCVDELKLLKDIEKLLNRDIKKEFIDGYAVDKSIKAELINKGKRPHSGAPRRGKPSGPKVSGSKPAGAGRRNKPSRPGKNARSTQGKRPSGSGQQRPSGQQRRAS